MAANGTFHADVLKKRKYAKLKLFIPHYLYTRYIFSNFAIPCVHSRHPGTRTGGRDRDLKKHG